MDIYVANIHLNKICKQEKSCKLIAHKECGKNIKLLKLLELWNWINFYFISLVYGIYCHNKSLKTSKFVITVKLYNKVSFLLQNFIFTLQSNVLLSLRFFIIFLCNLLAILKKVETVSKQILLFFFFCCFTVEEPEIFLSTCGAFDIFVDNVGPWSQKGWKPLKNYIMTTPNHWKQSQTYKYKSISHIRSIQKRMNKIYC